MSIVTRPTIGTSAPSSSTTRGGAPRRGSGGLVASGPEKPSAYPIARVAIVVGAWRAPGGAVAHGVAGADRADRDDARPQRGHRLGRGVPPAAPP